MVNIEKQVVDTIKKYKLLNKKEKIVVALSGGKDSTSIVYILKKQGYNVHALLIDLYLGSWSKMHNEKMTKFCAENSIPLTIVDLKKELGQGICFIKAVVKKKKNLTGCSVCGSVKRWILNRWAKKLGANKLVTGHNLDDETQNVLMNFLKGNVLLGVNSSPATGGRAVEGFVQRVKPFFFVAEDDIRAYAKSKNFDILYEKCPCAFGTYRTDTREWMKNIKNSEKLAVVKGFQEVIPKLRIENVVKMKKCKKCGEPARGELCSFCRVMDCVN
jgi:uncharacterized protein (TIGR00269 family)